MTEGNKREYIKASIDAIKKAGMDVVSIIPEDDYIEVICPSCSDIEIFRFEELDKIKCPVCYRKSKKKKYERIATSKILAAGFGFVQADYDEDCVIAECPVCNHSNSYFLRELDNLSCGFCLLKKKAQEHNLILYSNRDDYPGCWELQYDEFVLECQECYCNWKISIDDIKETPFQEIICKNCYARSVVEARGFSVTWEPVFENVEYGENAFPITCNVCGNVQCIDLNALDLFEKLEKLCCESVDCESDLIREETASENVLWCRDELNIFSAFKIQQLNELELRNGGRFNFSSDEEYEVFIGYDPEYYSDNKVQETIFAFFVFKGVLNPWNEKYLFLTFDPYFFINDGRYQGNGYIKWPSYYEELYSLIITQINDRKHKEVNTAYFTLIDRYLNCANSVFADFPEMVNLGISLRKTKRMLAFYESLSGKTNYILEDCWYADYLRYHSCPVCKFPFRESSEVCVSCGFSDLNRVFINEDEARRWHEDVVIPYRRRYEAEHNR